MGFNPSALQREAVAASVVRFGNRRDDPIGRSLEEARGRLARVAGELAGHLEEHARPLIEEAQRQLRQACCRIGIVGQVKAGKSTFINALVRQPDLLPTDINPCTAVVTLLNFRRGEAAPEHAARFTMFSADEWSRLADGGGYLRELTERLVPSFHPDMLRAQLEFMRNRAEHRMGPSFKKLLGQCHRFKEITPDLIADYVSAGDDYEGGADDRRRGFSDITRTAELNMADGPFAFPTTLIDTPGINDPFLVRDEITRRCLENPDIFVFVVSALQPPSAADIAMLRLLNGLNKDRIVVFVNRLDQVADPIADKAAIKSAVEQRLRRELPALDIPVIVGSAWLGNLAHRVRQGNLGPVPDQSRKPLLEAAGLGADADAGTLSAAERSRVAAALYESSGMGEVSAAIGRLMSVGSSAILFRQIAACLVELVRSAEISAEAELNSVEGLLAARRTEAGALAAKITSESQSLDQFEERANAVQATFRHLESHLGDIVTRGSVALRNELQHIVRVYAEEQSAHMLHSLKAPKSDRAWACDAMTLRDRLEAAYLAAFGQMADDVVRVEGFLYPQLRIIVAKLLPDCHEAFMEAPSTPLEPIPSAPLSAAVALDLGRPWWQLWFAARRSPEERAQHLRQLIEREFGPVTEALAHLAQKRLTERTSYTVERANAISASMLAGIERRRDLLAAQCRQLCGDGDKQTLQRFISEQEQRAVALKTARAAFGAFGEELGRLTRLLEDAVTEPSSA